MTNDEIIRELRNEDVGIVEVLIYAMLEEEKSFPSQSVARFRGRLEDMVKNREGGDNTVRDISCRLIFDRERDVIPGRD